MKRLILVLVLCGSVQQIVAQSGPGGIGDSEGTSNLIFWIDANECDSIVSGSALGTVLDLSGYGNDVASNQGKIQFVKNVVNGNHVFRFDGINSDLRGDLGDFDAPGTIIAIVNFDQALQGVDDNDYVFSIGTQTSAGTNTSMGRRKDEDGGGTNENLVYTWDGANVHYSSTTLSGSAWYAMVHQLNETNASSKYHQTFVNGSELSFPSDFPSALNSDGEFEIGDFRSAIDTQFKLDGDIAEVMIFDRILNTAELNILHSYLAGKYDISDISIGTEYTDFYDGDDASNGGYDLNIIGVGRHDSDEISSSALAAGLTLDIYSFNDGDYVLAGHKVSENSINTTDISDSSPGEDIEARWDRVWYVDVSDADNSATLDFTFNIPDAGLGGKTSGNSTNYKLIYRSGQSGDWEVLDDVAFMQGFGIKFKFVPVGAHGDGYYTLATLDELNSSIGIDDGFLEVTGPGGLADVSSGSNLELWLDATTVTSSDGDHLTRLPDMSGKSNDATQSNYLSQPSYSASANTLNGNAVIEFDGSDDHFTGNLGSNLSADATVVALARFDLLNQSAGVTNNDYIVSIGDDLDDNSHISISRRRDEGGNLNKYYSFDASSGGGTSSLGPVIDGQEWILITGLHEISVAASQRHSVYFDGVKQTDPSPDYSDDFSATTTGYNIGRWVGTGNLHNGQIAEIIVFSKALNTPELNILHSYLSAKWAHALTSNDKYAGDDLGNGGVCDGLVACQPNYDFEVAGIGYENSESKESASSGGMKIDQVSGFDEEDYLMFGHNTWSNQDINTDMQVAAGLVQVRSERDWYMDITDGGTAITVDFTFDFNEMGLSTWPLGDASNYKLMFRETNEEDDDWTILASGSSINQDQVSFSSVTGFSGDGFITIGSINHSNSPLPVKLISFQGKALNSKVELKWVTTSESNNSHFEVFRSKDGLNYDVIGYHEGKGDESGITNYVFDDENPVKGAAYYRLKQVDIGGNFEFSETIRVEYYGQEIQNLEFFPNPSSDELNIEILHEYEVAEAFLRNGNGEVVSRSSFEHGSSRMDIRKLEMGIYILEIRVDKKKERRKVIISR